MVEFCQFDDTAHVVGIIYLGWGTREAVPKERPAPHVNWLD
jgi:hypothetical protein